jgi:hypothetical protein
MQRSSDSIASLAAALAKAQIELSNPEKSLVGTIEPRAGEGGQRLFRYAPLSSGLEIVRKTLGQHEIATVQTTAIDQAAGIVNLTTVLAHASGEWIASDWPVCAISETATPHRMGAALTYARRYALFTLVGIAGEDDLDAPDLVTPTTQSLGPEKPKGANTGLNGGAPPHPDHRARVRRHVRDSSNLAMPSLAPNASAQLRDRLLTEVGDLGEADAAALWAQQSLPEKNRLTTSDAQQVEEAFQARLAHFVTDATDSLSVIQDLDGGTALQPSEQSPRGRSKKAGSKNRGSRSIDKCMLALPKPRRIRDREHVRYVAQQPCLICGRQPSDAHHLRFTQSRALGRKVSDEFTIPLCRGHHREVHRSGDEASWWRKTGIDSIGAARTLWTETRPLRSDAEVPNSDQSTAAPTALSSSTSILRRRNSTQNRKTKPIIAADPSSALSKRTLGI